MMGKIRFKDYLIDYLELNNISNKDFANRINISPKHLIDILSGEADISSQIIDNISLVTNISADYIYRIETNYKFENLIEDYLKKNNLTESKYLQKFCYKYLIENKFINFVDSNDKLEIIKDILKFLRVSSPEKVYEIDKKIFYKSKNDKPELLLLWLEKCYRATLNQTVANYKKENIELLVSYILECAKRNIFNEKELINKFNEYGIYLVIQEDIPGSKIRGAFKVHRDIPAVYLTYKHRRIADIYFALLHELAHCKSDFNKAKACNLVSFENEVDELEQKADEQAYNWMVPKKYYETLCCNNEYKISLEDLYPRSFIVYRLAKDGLLKYDDNQYQKYNFVLSDKKSDI